jgi:hypothetical protein
MHSSNPLMSRSLGFGSSVRFDGNGSIHEGMDRQYKIRLVERVSCVRSVIGHSEQHSFSLRDLHKPMISTSINASINMADNSSAREAAERAELSGVELLNISDHELKAVVEEQIVKLVEDLIRRATLNNDIRNEIDTLDSNGFNLLHYSCLYNQVALVPILLMRGAKINKKTGGGQTCVHIASAAGHLAIVKLLAEHKADLEESDENGNSAMAVANMHGHSDISAYLESVSHYSFFLSVFICRCVYRILLIMFLTDFQKCQQLLPYQLVPWMFYKYFRKQLLHYPFLINVLWLTLMRNHYYLTLTVII